jgi:psiF repeat-containing protein
VTFRVPKSLRTRAEFSMAALRAFRSDGAPIHHTAGRNTMSKSPILAAAAIVAALALASTATLAAESKAGAKPAASQQETEKDADRHEPAEGTQQHKMKVCNAEAHERGLKGDDRRAFMSSCLRK